MSQRPATSRVLEDERSGHLAEPQEIADTVALLASPRAASTTGTEVVVDCGMIKT